MDNLVTELKELLQGYAKEQKATWSLNYNGDAKTLTAALSYTRKNGDVKVASVHYGPEDFEVDDPSAADILEFLKAAWVNA